MQRKGARELLVESFRELARKKSIDKITVREVTVNCGYSTATFYRHFRDKYDLIVWEYTSRVEKLMAGFVMGRFTWREVLVEAALFCWSEKEYLANLLKHTSGHDSFVRYMSDINYNSLMRYVVASGKEYDEMTDLYVRMYILGAVNLTCEWILGKCEMTPETLAAVYDNSVPPPIRKYFSK